MCSRSRAWIARLLARHGAAAAALRPLEFVFVQPASAPAAVLQTAFHAWQLRMGVSLQLGHTLRTRVDGHVCRAFTPTSPSGRSTDFAERVHQPPAIAPVERVLMRHHRIEARSSAQSLVYASPRVGQSPPADFSQFARPIEFVHRHQHTYPAVSRERDSELPRRMTADVRSRPAAVTEPPSKRPSSIPLTPHELSRFTDDVLKAIDKRAVSHRERMGAP